MKQFVNGYFYKVAIGVGLLVLVGLVAADIWLWQSDDDSPVAGQSATTESDVPGFPTRSGDSNSSNASATDSVILEIQRQGVESESGLIAGDSPSISDSFQLETTGTGPASTVGDSATASDSAELLVKEAPPPPPSGGGPSDQASFGDSADLVVRDSSGNIKKQESVK